MIIKFMPHWPPHFIIYSSYFITLNLSYFLVHSLSLSLFLSQEHF